ncbi:methylmalonyl Co-A mutase-associated GTPase MeaB, partial [Seonamhaeicola marinus]
KTEFTRALHFYPTKVSGWLPKVTTCSALNNEGINTIWDIILQYIKTTKANNYFNIKRNQQNKYWLIQTIETQLKSNFFNTPNIKAELKNQLNLIETNQTTPFAAADVLLNMPKL